MERRKFPTRSIISTRLLLALTRAAHLFSLDSIPSGTSAPEIMLSWKEYTKSIDVWSVGCIFAELLGRRPLFPGKDYIHQLNLITDVIGTPDEDDVDSVESEKARR